MLKYLAISLMLSVSSVHAGTLCNMTAMGTAPYLEGAPTITMTNAAVLGQVFTLTPGLWQNCAAPNVCAIADKWIYGDTGAPAAGTQGLATYTAVAADVGHPIQVTETATNSGGSASITSVCN